LNYNYKRLRSSSIGYKLYHSDNVKGYTEREVSILGIDLTKEEKVCLYGMISTTRRSIIIGTIILAK